MNSGNNFIFKHFLKMKQIHVFLIISLSLAFLLLNANPVSALCCDQDACYPDQDACWGRCTSGGKMFWDCEPADVCSGGCVRSCSIICAQECGAEADDISDCPEGFTFDSNDCKCYPPVCREYNEPAGSGYYSGYDDGCCGSNCQ